jgi:4'-phosphopantetheinyl transferase EntD
VPTRDPALATALARLVPPGVLIDHRLIAAGDENAFLPTEAASFERSAVAVRRRSGAARIVARELLGTLGVKDFALVRSEAGGLVWPTGFLGAVAHDDEVAIAVIAKRREFAALGVDVEPARALPAELFALVATPAERQRYPELCASPVLFVAKEAIFKATYPTDGVFLDFQDIEVDIDAGCASTRHGRPVAVSVATFPRVVGIAFIRYQAPPALSITADRT